MANAYPEISQKHIDKAIVRGIGEVARKTQPLVPVKTGNLKNSFFPQFQPFVGWIGFIVKYANAVNSLYSVGTPYKHPSKNKNAVAGFSELGAQGAMPVINSSFEKALNDIVKEMYNKL